MDALLFVVVLGVPVWQWLALAGAALYVYQSLNPRSRGWPILVPAAAAASKAIPDRFRTLQDVVKALREAGLESSNLIVGIDYTKSNEHAGERTFQGKSLHTISNDGRLNPYQEVIKIIGETLSEFDDDKLIPTFGFGDIRTSNHSVFDLCDGMPCQGFEEVLRRYAEITPYVQLSGPTNFAPIIHRAIDIVREEHKYHILLIIADGQVVDKRATEEAIVEASQYPLSIVMIGVGDGPWDDMVHYDDDLPKRQFDNFQFVDFHAVTSPSVTNNRQAYFAMNALMEVPDQYRAIRALGLLDRPSSSSSSPHR